MAAPTAQHALHCERLSVAHMALDVLPPLAAAEAAAPEAAAAAQAAAAPLFAAHTAAQPRLGVKLAQGYALTLDQFSAAQQV